MKLQQLRYIRGVAQRDLNVSEAAQALFTSQPGMSKQIRQLESELGVPIFSRSGQVNKAFAARGLSPSDIDGNRCRRHKDRVQRGLGIGLLAAMVFDPATDKKPRALDVSHLFEPGTTQVGIRKGSYLRRFAFDFIELFAPHLTRAVVTRSL